MRRRANGILALLLATLVLTGCVGIPTSGDVTVGQKLEEQDSGDFEFFPLAPTEGADREAILAGFVAAFTGSAENFRVAREFLSQSFADDWKPRSGVTVRTALQRFSSVDQTTMEYSVTAAATVDSAGAYRQNGEPVPLTLRFEFVQEDGEWRIDSAPDGIVLADATFRSIFDTHVLYFLGPTDTALVPDLRWFPSGSAALRVVSALLAGPPDWLRGAASTAFPEGTKLVAPSVEVQSGVAIVDLSTAALEADLEERQLMQLQLTRSLAAVPNVRRVSLSVGGTPLDIAELGASAPRSNPQVDSRTVALAGGTFGYVSGGEIAPIAPLSEQIAATGPRGATVSIGSFTAAVLGGEGVSLVRSGDPGTTLLDGRQNLTVPSLDEGHVWSASRSVPGSIRVFDFAGANRDLPTGLPADAEIVSIDVSRDGARIAIFASTPAGPRLQVRAINRDPNSNEFPASLSGPALDVVAASGAAVDASWIDELSVATLVRDQAEGSVVLYQVGGERTSLSGIPPATALVGGNGGSGLRALGESGTILERSGNSWTDTRRAVGFLATQR